MKKIVILFLIAFLLVAAGCTEFPGASTAPSDASQSTMPSGEPTATAAEPSVSPVETSPSPKDVSPSPQIPEPSQDQQADKEYRADGIGAVNALKEALSAADNPEVTDELIRLFYDYYSRRYLINNHVNELRLLPTFEEDEAPDWDDLLVFAFEFSNPVTIDNGEYFMSKESVEETFRRFFPEFEYTHHDSFMFRFTGEGYIPYGYDILGSYYYRLKDISRDANGVFSAQFDVFAIEEGEMSEPKSSPYHSKNGSAVYNAAGDIEYFPDQKTFDDAMKKLLTQPDYLDILDLNVRVSIKFRLSDSPTDAFIYLACSKEYV